MQSFTKRLKAIFSQRGPPKKNSDNKKVSDWLEKRKKYFEQTKKEAEKLIGKYQLQSKSVLIKHALIDLPLLINGAIPNTIFILIVSAEDFEKMVKGENFKSLDMLLPKKRIFAKTKSRIFSFRIGLVRIYADANFNASDFYRMLWNNLNHSFREYQGKVVKIENFIKYIKDNIGLYYDVIFDNMLISISAGNNVSEPQKQITLIY